MKKILSLLLLSAVLLAGLISCNNSTGSNDNDDQDPIKGIDISGYTIVRPENADNELTKFVTLFKQEIKRYTGTDLKVKTDYLDDSESAEGVKEIIIGECERAESTSAANALSKAPDNGITIRATDNKIVILGKTDAATIRAMKYFLMTYAQPTDHDNYITLEVGSGYNGTVHLDSLIFDNFTEIYTEFKSNVAIAGRDFPRCNTGYETLIQLNHNGEYNGTLFASFATYDINGYQIYKSTDNGKTWKYVSTALDNYNNGADDRKNPTKHMASSYKLQPCLFELPKDMGDFKKGTLILGACTNGQGYYKGAIDSTTSMTLYYSTDLGVTWNAYVNVDLAGNDPDDSGVWEPFFIFDEETGRVYCYYSDESNEQNDKPGNPAQKLVYKYSTDMKTWVGKDGKTEVTADPFDAIRGDEPFYRPGMASVAKMGNGKYFMTYELCIYINGNIETSNGCPIYYSISDSIDWKNIDGFGDYGKPLVTEDGYQFGSSPWCAWTPAGGECGTLVIVGNHNVKGEPITKDEMGNKMGTDMILSFDYGETFIRIKNPIPYYTYNKTAYSPHLSFSADGRTLFYVNNPPDETTKAYQKIVFASIKVW